MEESKKDTKLLSVKTNYKDRSGIKVAEMSNNNTIWLREDSIINCNIIMDHLEKDFKEVGSKRKMTFAQVSRETKICASSVSSACYFLAFRKEPLVKIWAEKTVSHNKKPHTRMRVRLR